MAKKKKEKKVSPIVILLIITLIIALLSLVGSIFSMQGVKTSIVSGTLETSLLTVKNILSFDGIKYLFSNIFTKYQMLEPIVMLIISFITLSILEASGFLNIITEHLKKRNFKYITFLTLFISIISSVMGDYSFAIIMPLTALIYKGIGRNPIIGILTSFLGLTMGYGTGLFFNYNDYILGVMTENAAIIDIDKNFNYSLFSNVVIMVVSTLILSFVGSIIIEKILIPLIPKYKKVELESEKYIFSKKGFRVSIITMFLLVLIAVYMVIPNLPVSGILLDNEASNYVDKLLGVNAPFMKSLPVIIMFITIIISYIYGKLSSNIKDSFDFTNKLTSMFDQLGYIFVLLFFYTLMITILDYTSLSSVIAVNFIEFMSKLQFSGLPLIVTVFVFVIIIGIFIPNTILKWELMAPLTVPLLMRANITPNFTVFIFKAADGISKAASPFFVFFIVMLALLNKYNSRDEDITLFGTIKMLLMPVILFALLWLLIILCWYIVGLPIGIGVNSTI